MGKIYNIRLDITIPGKEIAVTHEAREDLYAAITDAFDTARCQLEDYARLQRKDIKQHEISLHGHIEQLFLDQDYGYIKSIETNEQFYFHRSNVIHLKFDQLKIGDEVRFIARIGAEGPHAVRVTAGKHHTL